MYPLSSGAQRSIFYVISMTWRSLLRSSGSIDYQDSCSVVISMTRWSCLGRSGCHQLSEELVECYANYPMDPLWSTSVLLEIGLTSLVVLPITQWIFLRRSGIIGSSSLSIGVLFWWVDVANLFWSHFSGVVYWFRERSEKRICGMSDGRWSRDRPWMLTSNQSPKDELMVTLEVPIGVYEYALPRLLDACGINGFPWIQIDKDSLTSQPSRAGVTVDLFGIRSKMQTNVRLNPSFALSGMVVRQS